MDEAEAILIITDYIANFEWSWEGKKAEETAYLSYAKSAAYNLIDYIADMRNTGIYASLPDFEAIICIINQFVLNMDEYSKKNPKTKYQFTVAHDIATNIFGIFYAMI